ncbi:protein NRDE2, partial [Tanacetum coccineum]
MNMNQVHIRNKVVKNPQGNVAAPLIGNNDNRQNANQIWCYNCSGVGHYEMNCTNRSRPTSSKTDTALVYDTVRISEVPNFDHYYDNEMYNLFTHEEQHPNLHESTHGTSVEYQNNSNIYSKYLDMDFSGGNVEQHDVNYEKTNAYFESLLYNFKVELDKCVMVNCNDKEKNHLAKRLDELTRSYKKMIHSLNVETLEIKTQISKCETAYSTLEK